MKINSIFNLRSELPGRPQPEVPGLNGVEVDVGYRNLFKSNPFRTPFEPDFMHGRSKLRMPGPPSFTSTPSSGTVSSGTEQFECSTL
jgi:hypothetical protein